MSEKRYILPAGMFAAFMCGYNICWTSYDGDERNKHFTCMEAGVRAVLRFLAENPIVPSETQRQHLLEHFSPFGVDHWDKSMWHNFIADCTVEFQRRMFVPPEPEVPKELEDLLDDDLIPNIRSNNHHMRIIEAFRRGQKAGNR